MNTIAKTITDNCEVIEIKSWDVEQAIKMFNSLNSDGLPLFDSDIIAAQLYAEAEKAGLQAKFSELWKQLNEEIGDLEASNIANFNSILMQYMYYVRVINKETVSESGSINVTTPGLRRYFIDDNRAPITNPIKMCKLPFFLNIPITGEMVFPCDRRIWQSALFDKFVFNRNSEDENKPSVHIKRVQKWIEKYNKQLVKSEFVCKLL